MKKVVKKLKKTLKRPYRQRVLIIKQKTMAIDPTVLADLQAVADKDNVSIAGTVTPAVPAGESFSVSPAPAAPAA